MGVGRDQGGDRWCVEVMIAMGRCIWGWPVRGWCVIVMAMYTKPYEKRTDSNHRRNYFSLPRCLSFKQLPSSPAFNSVLIEDMSSSPLTPSPYHFTTPPAAFLNTNQPLLSSLSPLFLSFSSSFPFPLYNHAPLPRSLSLPSRFPSHLPHRPPLQQWQARDNKHQYVLHPCNKMFARIRNP